MPMLIVHRDKQHEMFRRMRLTGSLGSHFTRSITMEGRNPVIAFKRDEAGQNVRYTFGRTALECVFSGDGIKPVRITVGYGAQPFVMRTIVYTLATRHLRLTRAEKRAGEYAAMGTPYAELAARKLREYAARERAAIDDYTTGSRLISVIDD